MFVRRLLTVPVLAVGMLLSGAAAPVRAEDHDLDRFPWILVENPTGQPDSSFIGPPDDVFADLGDLHVIYEFDCGVIEDGPGGDFNVYEVDWGVAEFERMDVLVSASGSNFVSVKATEGP
ncbi:MAG: hypothetical protein JSU86_18760, partial [Phycisphaerales bacterium]